MCSSKQTNSAYLVVNVESEKKNDDAAMLDIMLNLLYNHGDIDIDNYYSTRQPSPSLFMSTIFNIGATVSMLPHKLEFLSSDKLWDSRLGSGDVTTLKWKGGEVEKAMNKWEVYEWMMDEKIHFDVSRTPEIQDP